MTNAYYDQCLLFINLFINVFYLYWIVRVSIFLGLVMLSARG